jgi:hypothetical protein
MNNTIHPMFEALAEALTDPLPQTPEEKIAELEECVERRIQETKAAWIAETKATDKLRAIAASLPEDWETDDVCGDLEYGQIERMLNDIIRIMRRD